MARSVGIISYGTPDDRLRLEALAKVANISSSAWILECIRRDYKALFGDTPPKEVARAR